MKFYAIINRAAEDIIKIQEEEQYAFVRGILIQIGIPVEDVCPMDYSDFQVEQKIQFRKVLSRFQTDIQNVGDQLEITCNNQRVASWSKPVVSWQVVDKILKAKIEFESWSAFEGNK